MPKEYCVFSNTQNPVFMYYLSLTVGTFISAISWAVICFQVPNYISLRCKICCCWLQFYNLFSAILQFFSSKSTNSFDIILVKPILFFSRSILKSIFENTTTSFVIQMKYLQYFFPQNQSHDWSRFSR